MELHPYTTDLGFARRSARYLATSGCSPRQIIEALVEQLDLSFDAATQIVGGLTLAEARVS
ncbi:MAG: hypothetical protein R2733_18400 [Acidimicrobiales bacterium]